MSRDKLGDQIQRDRDYMDRVDKAEQERNDQIDRNIGKHIDQGQGAPYKPDTSQPGADDPYRII